MSALLPMLLCFGAKGVGRSTILKCGMYYQSSIWWEKRPWRTTTGNQQGVCVAVGLEDAQGSIRFPSTTIAALAPRLGRLTPS